VRARRRRQPDNPRDAERRGRSVQPLLRILLGVRIDRGGGGFDLEMIAQDLSGRRERAPIDVGGRIPQARALDRLGAVMLRLGDANEDDGGSDVDR
jgi:hypothetical protein